MLNRYNSLPSKIVPQNYEAHATGTLDVAPDTAGDVGFLIGGAHDAVEGRGAFVSRCYNGKIDRCGM